MHRKGDDGSPSAAYLDPVTAVRMPPAPSPGALRPVAGDGFRGPFARWPRAADAVLALVLLVLVTVFATGPDDSVVVRSPADVPAAILLLFVVGSGALAWRRRAPVVVLAVVLAAWGLTLGSGFSDLGGHALVALYATARYSGHDRAGLVGGEAALVVLVLDGVTGPAPWSEVAVGAVVFFAVWYAGTRLRLRSQRSARLLQEKAEEAQRIVAEERARIARELHDVVAHRVSLMTVQAGAAKTVAAADPEAAIRAMAAVETAGRQALDELRHLLGVLRPAAAEDAMAPQPGLGDLPQLIAQTRAAGLDVTLSRDGVPEGLPARVELSAYRMVQESLTNVLKHAGPGARAVVALTIDHDRLVVEVTDAGIGTTSLPGTGHGLIGMRERALLLGGDLDVGPLPAGGFRVRARLPLAAGGS